MAVAIKGAPTYASWVQWLESDSWSGKRAVVPMLPPAVGTTIAMALDPDVDVARLTRIISSDQVLATRVLRLANSAHCGPLEEITSIHQATVRLGTAAVCNVVLAVCLSSRLADARVYGTRGRLLLDHSIGTACLARALAPAAGVDSDEAFLCGLVHDIGKLFVLKLAKDAATLGAPKPTEAEVTQGLASRHADMGAYLLRAWKLPAMMVEAVQCHHSPESAKQFFKEVAVTSVANHLSHRYGFGCERTPDDSILENPTALSVGLSASALATLDQTAASLFEAARGGVSG